MKVLFLCRANAGRSQMAEAFYNAMTRSYDATSAGVDLANSVQGSDPSLPPLVREVMAEKGYDLSAYFRKEVTPHMVEEADMVIAITDHPLPDYVEQSPKLVKWLDIPDAVRTPIEFHRDVRDMVEKRVREMIS